MKLKNIYSWKVNPRQAIRIQNALKPKIKLARLKNQPNLIAGVDVAFKQGKAIGAVVVLDFRKLEVVEKVRRVTRSPYPYIPGLLTFREGPVLEKCFRCLKNEPDVIMFDGQGLAHPRNMGLATHMGILLNKATIGCAKTRLYGKYREPERHRAAFSYLFDDKGKKIGVVLRTRDNIKPVYVSPGNKIDIRGSRELVLRCAKKYRLPEPIRLAHQLTKK